MIVSSQACSLLAFSSVRKQIKITKKQKYFQVLDVWKWVDQHPDT